MIATRLRRDEKRILCKSLTAIHCCALVEELRFFRLYQTSRWRHQRGPCMTCCTLMTSFRPSCVLATEIGKSGDLRTHWTTQLAATASVTPPSNNVFVLESPAWRNSHSFHITDMCHRGPHVRCEVHEVRISPCRCLAGRRNMDAKTQLVRNRLRLAGAFCTSMEAYFSHTREDDAAAASGASVGCELNQGGGCAPGRKQKFAVPKEEPAGPGSPRDRHLGCGGGR